MGSYSMGKKTGLWIWNLKDKMGLEMKGTFSNDLQEGKWEYYFSTGALSYLANYKNGLRNGEWIYFYKDSTLFRQGKYLNDLKEGTWKTWHEDGTLLMEGNYEKGKEQGAWKAFWENGRLKNKSFFDEGYLKGTWLSYSPTGILLLEGEYKNGQKVGAWEEYYNNGRLKEESRYKLKKIKHKDGNVVVMGNQMLTFLFFVARPLRVIYLIHSFLEIDLMEPNMSNFIQINLFKELVNREEKGSPSLNFIKTLLLQPKMP